MANRHWFATAEKALFLPVFKALSAMANLGQFRKILLKNYTYSVAPFDISVKIRGQAFLSPFHLTFIFTPIYCVY